MIVYKLVAANQSIFFVSSLFEISLKYLRDMGEIVENTEFSLPLVCNFPSLDVYIRGIDIFNLHFFNTMVLRSMRCIIFKRYMTHCFLIRLE